MKYVLLICVLMVAGCESDIQRSKARKDVKRLDNEMIAKICEQKGGVPIISEWSSRVSDCIFPPKP